MADVGTTTARFRVRTVPGSRTDSTDCKETVISVTASQRGFDKSKQQIVISEFFGRRLEKPVKTVSIWGR